MVTCIKVLASFLWPVEVSGWAQRVVKKNYVQLEISHQWCPAMVDTA